MPQNWKHCTAILRNGLLPMLALTAVTAIPATAQTTPTPAVPQRSMTGLVTKTDLQATGAQLGQKITAQADELTALRQQLLAMKAQLEALHRQVNGMKVPTVSKASQILSGH